MSWQSPNNNCRVRLRSLLRWKNALNHDYKIHNGHNFQFTKFSFIDFVLTDRRRLSGKQPKSASGKSSSCRFLFSAERNANTKVTEYVTFGFFFNIGFLPLLEKFVLESTVDGIFLSFVPLIQTLQIYSNEWSYCNNLDHWNQVEKIRWSSVFTSWSPANSEPSQPSLSERKHILCCHSTCCRIYFRGTEKCGRKTITPGMLINR